MRVVDGYYDWSERGSTAAGHERSDFASRANFAHERLLGYLPVQPQDVILTSKATMERSRAMAVVGELRAALTAGRYRALQQPAAYADLPNSVALVLAWDNSARTLAFLVPGNKQALLSASGLMFFEVDLETAPVPAMCRPEA